jgi:hypothetical protein
VKFELSPVASVPDVIVGVAAALVVPSYPFVFVAAVTVIARAVITPVVLFTNVTA